MFFAGLVIVFLVLWGILSLALPHLWAALTALAGRIASLSMRYGFIQRAIHATSRLRDYLPVVVILVLGVAVVAWTGDEFLDVAELVHAKSPSLQQMDLKAHDWAVTRRTSNATTFFETMSTVGGPAGVGVIVGIALVALLLARHFSRAGYLAVTTSGGGLLDLELKNYFARARPDVAEALRRAQGFSFPSGHAMGSAVVFGALAYVAFRTIRQWRWKAASVAVGITMIISVAISRVYLGVHWLSDVTAGVVCGLLWVTVTTVAYETFRRVHLIRTIRATRAAADEPAQAS
jgi:membrane-associated phospholipid phosphatase